MNQVLTDIDTITRDLAVSGDGDLWERLGASHRRLIEQKGFETFKRHINFEYGQWRVTQFHRRFMLRAIAAVLRRGRLPTIATVNWSDADTDWPPIHLRAYAFYCGLLWQIAGTADKLNCLWLTEPSFGKPMPVKLDGRLISQDLAMSAMELNTMAEHIPPFRSVRRVLEIGGGYGRLAYAFRSLFPAVEYTIADIAPALAVSQNYIAKIFGEDQVSRYGSPAQRQFNFRSPAQLAAMSDSSFDLVINISSFDEMPIEVSSGYLKDITRLCSGYVFLSGYARAVHPGCHGLDEMNYPPLWQLIYHQKHELYPGWVNKIFRVGFNK